jgi:hypothetical protein
LGKVELFGTKGGVVMSPELRYTRSLRQFVNIQPDEHSIRLHPTHSAEIKGIVDAATGKSAVRRPADDDRRAVKILDCIYSPQEREAATVFDDFISKSPRLAAGFLHR